MGTHFTHCTFPDQGQALYPPPWDPPSAILMGQQLTIGLKVRAALPCLFCTCPPHPVPFILPCHRPFIFQATRPTPLAMLSPRRSSHLRSKGTSPLRRPTVTDKPTNRHACPRRSFHPLPTLLPFMPAGSDEYGRSSIVIANGNLGRLAGGWGCSARLWVVANDGRSVGAVEAVVEILQGVSDQKRAAVGVRCRTKCTGEGAWMPAKPNHTFTP